MRITYVVGASGAGKTTFHNRLADAAPQGVATVELDDHTPGPAAGHAEWLAWRAAELLQLAADLDAGDKEAADVELAPGKGLGSDVEHIVVTGITVPFDLVGTYAWMNAAAAGVPVSFVMIDRPWADVAASLEERLADWDEDDRSEQIENNRRLHRRLRTQVEALADGHVVENGDLDEVLAVVGRC
jgi:hypothetical protein